MNPERSEGWTAWLPDSRMLWADKAGLLPWVEKPEFVVEASKTYINGN